ncbi:MAG: type II toxin-antitoxin system antitoxin, RelB/DinJ family [Desulfobulbus propionicus]|nr:MAG: type II toxin-antitoxin system antitoxin, RelB/DinJ family [Desulfobulbus propionicus]
MSKTSSVRARMEPDLKGKAEQIFQQLGLTTTQAITLLYKQVELQKGLLFDGAIPNKTTFKTFSKTVVAHCGKILPPLNVPL